MLIHLFPLTVSMSPSNNRPSRLETLAFASVNIGDLAAVGCFKLGISFWSLIDISIA